MLRLIGLVVSIALADALNPATVGPGLYLASGEHPRRAVLEFTGAVAAVNFAGGVLLTVAPGQLLLALIPHPGATLRYIAETVAGVSMLIAAALLWVYRRRLGRRNEHESEPKRRSPVSWPAAALPTREWGRRSPTASGGTRGSLNSTRETGQTFKRHGTSFHLR